MVYSQVPNSHGIGSEYGDDRRSTVGGSRNREPILAERIATERVSKDEVLKFRKMVNNREYRQRQKSKMEKLEAENEKLKAENEESKAEYDDLEKAYEVIKGENHQFKCEIKCLKQEMEWGNQKLEIQSKELDGLRKTCDKLEEKNAEEHEGNRRLKSKLKKRKEEIESLKGKYVNAAFETPSYEKPPYWDMQLPLTAEANFTPQVPMLHASQDPFGNGWPFEG